MVRSGQDPPPYDGSEDDEPTSYDGPKSGVKQEVEDDLQLQLGDAFTRFQRSYPRLGFTKLLSMWVTIRKECGLAVDDDDPDASAPSLEFRRFLRKRFYHNRRS